MNQKKGCKIIVQLLFQSAKKHLRIWQLLKRKKRAAKRTLKKAKEKPLKNECKIDFSFQESLIKCMETNQKCLKASAFQKYLNLGEDDARSYSTDYKVRAYECGPGKNSKQILSIFLGCHKTLAFRVITYNVQGIEGKVSIWKAAIK